MPARRILYIGTLPPFPGGSGIVCAQLLKGLAARGHRIRAIAPTTVADGTPVAPDSDGVQVTRFLLPRHPTNSVSPLEQALVEQMREQSLAHLAAALAAAPADVILLGRESFVWGVPELAAAHGVATLQIAHAEASAAIAGRFSNAFRDRLVRQLARVHRVVAVADHVTRGLRALGLGNVVTIVNPVDPDRFSPGPRDPGVMQHLDLPADAVVAMHGSNLKPSKRAGEIVESAVATVAARPDLYYVIVGDGPERPALQSAAEGHGIAGRFRFTGWIEHAHIAPYYRLSDIFLLPSETEAMPLSCLEALASGCVPVTSDIPASREIIEPGITGLLHPVGNVDRLSELTLQAAGDLALRRRIAAVARMRATQHHALDHVVAAYDALIDGLVAEHASR